MMILGYKFVIFFLSFSFSIPPPPPLLDFSHNSASSQVNDQYIEPDKPFPCKPKSHPETESKTIAPIRRV